ncbi:MAG: hypothetical protein Fur0020_05120 [Thermodesulfovibrionia bacterium]
MIEHPLNVSASICFATGALSSDETEEAESIIMRTVDVINLIKNNNNFFIAVTNKEFL